MTIIPVHASVSYDVKVGKGLLTEAGNYIAQVCKPVRAAIISDTNVYPLYGTILENSLSDAGFAVYHYVMPAGESYKNADTYIKILNFLAENRFTKTDILIALGGGVVGDVTGFAAATYMRGIQYVQIPTTLLAMVDSSVGGKTAIDLPAGKNLAGAFYQPCLVLCDLNLLDSLPTDIFRDGCAEIIKYAVLFDQLLFGHLLSNGLDFDRESVICRCISLKRDVIEADEFDSGARQKLNFGHTIGHAIEKKSNYSISHGQAVAIGMAVVCKAAVAFGHCSESVYLDVCKILNLFNLPKIAAYSAKELYDYALSDKKRSGQTVNLITPLSVGNCMISKTSVEDLKSFIEAGI